MARKRRRTRSRSVVRRRAAARRSVRRNPARRRRSSARRVVHRGRRRSFRRNPAAFALAKQALGNGLGIIGGFGFQNFAYRNIPDIPGVPAMVQGIGKDVVVILAGAFIWPKVVGARMAENILGGQVAAAGIRVIRGLNIPVVSSAFSAYEPLRFADYTPGRRALPTQAPRLVGAGNGSALADYVAGQGAVAYPSLGG